MYDNGNREVYREYKPSGRGIIGDTPTEISMFLRSMAVALTTWSTDHIMSD